MAGTVSLEPPGSLQVLLNFPSGRKYTIRHDLNGNSWLPAFWHHDSVVSFFLIYKHSFFGQVAEATSIFRCG